MADDLVMLGLYMSTGTKPFPLESRHRIIWFNKAEDKVTLIRTDKTPLAKPKTLKYSKALEWIECKQLVLITREEVVPQLRLSDEMLAKRYPPNNRKPTKEKPDQPQTSAPLEYRQRWLPFIDDVRPHLPTVWRGVRSLSSVLEPACEKHGASLNESYQVLYRFLANKCSRLSIIPLRFLCGNPGEKRVGKGFALGRKTEAAKKAGTKNTNFPLTKEWLEKIADTYQETIARGVTSGKAYRTFLNLHCMISAEEINGKLKTTYLPIGKRPSKTQFLTHGPEDDPTQALWRKQLLDQEYEKNYRPLDGNTKPITFRTGLAAHVDASSNDRYLVSAFNRAQVVGTARAIPVSDQEIGYIWGIYTGWRVNKTAARLAILNAATDKVEMCARYGITIERRDWYEHLPSEFIGDRGEFNCDAVRESLGELNCSIEYVATGRADLRGRGERTHGLLHDHDANGSTYGKFRKRGEPDPAKRADQNIFDYTRELIRLVLYHNNFAPVPQLLTTEMRRANVKPTRRDILEFCMKNGYHHKISYSEDDLILALCPEYEAAITPDGIYPVVKRNIDSGDEILLKDLRYLGPFAESERWLETARLGKHRRIKIRMTPNDPRHAWYQDPDTGLHKFNLSTQDPLVARLATVHDLTLRKTDDTILLNQAKNEAEEAKATIELLNQAERKVIAKQKRDDVEKATGKRGNSSNAAGRRKALQNEVKILGQSPVPVTPSQTPQPSQVATQIKTNNVFPIRTTADSGFEDDFNRWLNGETV